MTDNSILYDLQKIHKVLTKTKEEHTLNFRMIKSTEKFNYGEPKYKTTKLGLIRLSVYNSVFNMNRRNNQFQYNTQGGAWPESRILAVTPVAYAFIIIAELIKEETNVSVIEEPDKNTRKCIMEIKRGLI